VSELCLLPEDMQYLVDTLRESHYIAHAKAAGLTKAAGGFERVYPSVLNDDIQDKFLENLEVTFKAKHKADQAVTESDDDDVEVVNEHKFYTSGHRRYLHRIVVEFLKYWKAKARSSTGAGATVTGTVATRH